MIRRANAEFVPLVLRAPFTNGQPTGNADETEIYRRVKAAMLAPQGIGILNGNGCVLEWTQMFASDGDVLAFLDRGLKRFGEKATSSESYSVFPTDRTEVIPHGENLAKLPKHHAEGSACPAARGKGRPPAGSLAVSLVGRALDEEGIPLTDTVNQEHYIEDSAWITPPMMKALAAAAAAADDKRFDVPGDVARALATKAHLGHIDVQPFLDFGDKGGNAGEWKRCALRARLESTADGVALFRLTGRTEIACKVAVNGNGVHDIALKWEGWFEMKEGAVVSLVAMARGREKLQFALDRPKSDQPEVRFLPGGRPIDLDAGVVYGLIGSPAKDTAGPGEGPIAPPESLLNKIRKLHETMERVRDEGGDPSVISRIMEEFEPHIQKHEFEKAEAVLDRALEALAKAAEEE